MKLRSKLKRKENNVTRFKLNKFCKYLLKAKFALGAISAISFLIFSAFMFYQLFSQGDFTTESETVRFLSMTTLISCLAYHVLFFIEHLLAQENSVKIGLLNFVISLIVTFFILGIRFAYDTLPPITMPIESKVTTQQEK